MLTDKQRYYLENDIFNTVENHCCESCTHSKCMDSRRLSNEDAVKEIMDLLKTCGVI